MRRFICVLMFFCLLFGITGCSGMFSETYVSLQPHRSSEGADTSGQRVASSYPEIYMALAQQIDHAETTGVIILEDLSEPVGTSYLEAAVRNVMVQEPVGAYAVEKIEFDVGTNAGRIAAAVNVTYSRSRTDLLSIKTVKSMDDAQMLIGQALEQAENTVTIRVEQYEQRDYAAMVRSYADANPDAVMEIPQVMAASYPHGGQNRLIELTFTYQNSREELLEMQELVQPAFQAAELYVQGDFSAKQKFEKLHSFLMERSKYTIRSSVTPTYSLLQEGVGDCRAFASVYAAMCRQAGLECRVINGTKEGEPWSWNRVVFNNRVYYIDLIEAKQLGRLQFRTSSQMSGYVWERGS